MSSDSPVPTVKARRINTPELPMADSSAPQRRVRIPELPVQEPDRQAMRCATRLLSIFYRSSDTQITDRMGLRVHAQDVVRNRHLTELLAARVACHYLGCLLGLISWVHVVSFMELRLPPRPGSYESGGILRPALEAVDERGPDWPGD